MRKTKEVIIGPDGGRDAGKAFVITEMDAFRTEKWALRALFVAARSGADVGDINAGLAGIAKLGITTVLNSDFASVEPLLDEMATCFQIRPDPAAANPDRRNVVRPLLPDDAEETATLFKLRGEWLSLHLGFSLADVLSTWASAQTLQQGSVDTSTSPPR